MQNLHICKICVYANLGHVYTALVSILALRSKYIDIWCAACHDTARTKKLITQTCLCNIILQYFMALRMKNCDIFLIFAQNIDHGYTLEPPQ